MGVWPMHKSEAFFNIQFLLPVPRRDWRHFVGTYGGTPSADFACINSVINASPCGAGAVDGGTGRPSNVAGSMISMRVPSGSKRLIWRFPFTPVFISVGALHSFGSVRVLRI